MFLAEFIEDLNKILKEKGDIPVCTWNEEHEYWQEINPLRMRVFDFSDDEKEEGNFLTLGD